MEDIEDEKNKDIKEFKKKLTKDNPDNQQPEEI